MKNKTYKIEVSEEHIDQGTPQDSSCCPIAIAARDLMIDEEGMDPEDFEVDVSGEGRIRVYNFSADIPYKGDNEKTYIFTLEPIDSNEAEAMASFIHYFDDDMNVVAKNFTVEKIVEENYGVWRYDSNDRVWWRIARLLPRGIW